ncbi:MAG: DUF3198 domain-containing protein [Candidatus Thermoplasmatota archaeon]|nr:DUF3198 domain-containing protein [Candidatus Thermoplasmatota archaeon]
MLTIGIIVALLGLVLVGISYSVDYTSANWTDFYEDILPRTDNGDWNLVVRVLSPIILLTGAWYAGEQLIYRRRFQALMETDKKSDFSRNLSDLEDLARDLPEKYMEELEEKQATFRSRR